MNNRHVIRGPVTLGTFLTAMVTIGVHLFGAASGALALEKTALDQIAAMCESKIFPLKVDLREPILAGETMQAPMLDRKGWHYVNPGGEVVLRAGTRVEVTGVFNYAERGLFLELAKESPGGEKEPAGSRPRVRIRIMTEIEAADPPGQAAEASRLIATVLEGASLP